MLTAVLALAPAADAQFGVAPEDWIAQVYGSDVDGHAIEDTATDQYGVDGIYDQAGGHPWKGITDFTFRTDGSGNPQGGNAARIRVDVPVGLVPNPTLFPRCPRVMFDAGSCPTDTQIGIEELTVKEGSVIARARVPLYNVEIAPDQVSLFGFRPADAPAVAGLASLAGVHPVYIVGGVRDAPSIFGPHDTGLFFTIDDAPEQPAVLRSKLTFWGVPGDPVHNAQRGPSCVTVLAPAPLPESCTPGAGVAHSDPELPFLTNPTKCDGAARITRLSLWSHAGEPNPTQVDDPTPTIEGKNGPQHCERVPFDPALEVTPDTAQPDAPVGPLVRLSTPQDGLADKDVLTTSHVKDVSVTLPPGMTLNPSAANGLEACTDAQLEANLGVVGGDECPEGSKVGTVDVKSPLLPDSVTGFAFVGQPLPDDMYRLFVTLEGRGVSIRLKGSVKPDPATGQLTAIFQNNPEQPFETFDVDFEDGPRAPLANPLDCGPASASGVFTPWSGTPPVTSASGFTIEGDGCPAGFQPNFGAATATPLAGAFAPFTATIERPDRNQYLARATVKTPPGLAGMISKVDQCSDAGANQGVCPEGSRIGTVTTTAGAGPEPFSLSGPVYFTGPYGGAPFGMVAVIRAIAGPYDLGTVVVRERIFVDPEDAHLTVSSDELPRILEGVPIRLRNVNVAIDKPGFVFNPTSCGDKPVTSTLHSTQGAAIDRSATLSLSGCEALAFGPRMSMQIIGPRQTRFGKHPGLLARVEQTGRQANIGRARVVLPKSLALDPKNSQNVCPVADAQRAQCPASTQIGTATAVSPALNRPLAGPVYFVQGIRTDPTTGRTIRTLPSLLAKLRGEIAINLRGTTAVEGGRLVSTFDRVPDAPVSRFDMRIKGGKTGPIAVTARKGVCNGRQITDAQLAGHNGKASSLRVNMIKPCRRPMLIIRKIKAGESRLSISGTIRAKASKRIAVSIRCGGTRVAKGASRPRPARWRVGLRLRGGCSSADEAKLTIRYPGGGHFRAAKRSRKVNLPGGS
jgi:hypothetical protein